MITHDLRVIADAIQDKKGQNVISLDLRSMDGAISDFFVVCNADSTTNVSAIADNILKEAREQLGIKPLRMQGMENNFWIILDYGNIVVHVFQTPYRDFYRLEDLWADVPRKEYALRSNSRRKKNAGEKE
ncbi:MAG: ribosome silencing factor [Bacteroidales bacterium]|nr:ribosome silencing factor [Bacteroidales bacterium]